MKRVILAVAVIIVLMSGAVISLLFLKKNSIEIKNYAERIQFLYESGDVENALKKADELSRLWDEKSLILNVLVDTDRISAINTSVYKVRPFIESDSDELIAELQSISANARWLYACEKPYWYNIF